MHRSLNIKGLLSGFIVVTILLLLWMVPAVHVALESIDRPAAYFLNSLLSTNHSVHLFWAFFNSRAGDWIYDGVILLFIIYHVMSGKGEEREKRLMTFFVLLAYILLCYLCHVIFFHFASIRRISPTGVLDGLANVYQLVGQESGRMSSSLCYPSNHACTIFRACFAVTYLMGWRGGTLFFLTSCFFFLPRLVVGAHWISDILVGSLPLIWLDFCWVFYTPGFDRIVDFCYRYSKSGAKPWRPHENRY